MVVRRILNSSLDHKGEFQRETIFQTRCTVAGKVCTMIVDGGCCTSIASQTLVSKLKLATVPHPSPYILEWLNEGEGRPWLFDRRVIHDGFKNTYSFVHNNRKITLTPITPARSALNEFQPIKEQVAITDDDCDNGTPREDGSNIEFLVFKELKNKKEDDGGQLTQMNSNVFSKSSAENALDVLTKSDSNNEALNQISVVPTLTPTMSLIKLYGYCPQEIVRVLDCVFTIMGTLHGNIQINNNGVHYMKEIPPEPPPKQGVQHKILSHAMNHLLWYPSQFRFKLYAIGYPPEIPPEPPPDFSFPSLRTNFLKDEENDRQSITDPVGVKKIQVRRPATRPDLTQMEKMWVNIFQSARWKILAVMHDHSMQPHVPMFCLKKV
ncbi:uncharacterized protein LOC118488465 [Helianthus annuus]|uniref:uncharacterized protein LOC118479565 n=1 Tax=Helianthus annuus TaxID=4232 RepID=UPI001652D7B1|nr:uncharacterized protein LOC118479565 [Helianthus annuus]XP_035841970.1 uncharacterized protein LOC118488465 [Helianthus annuus]